MRLLVSPWTETFDLFVHSISHAALIVSPFISKEPLSRLSSILEKCSSLKVQILTNLDVGNLIQGSTDVSAIASFCRTLPSTTVKHLPGLHAKVYVADDKLAILTSSNLTTAGLDRNYEYGVEITDHKLVCQISDDLTAYGDLGAEVSLLDLDQLGNISRELHDRQDRTLKSAKRVLRQEFEREVQLAHEALMYLRAKPGESTNKIFSRTILYLLRNGPLSTQQIHPAIQRIHPDLCDNSIDRVINGVHFGKRWKHMVRNAEQGLKSANLIGFDGRKWHLIPN
ncbi:MAG: phospholipase D-like domain-containing protein [Chloroflexota bacterium]